MTYDVSRDTADVRIHCGKWESQMKQFQSEDVKLTGNTSTDNDARWSPVPNDPVSIARGMMPNSQRIRGMDQEFEDPVNFHAQGYGESRVRGISDPRSYVRFDVSSQHGRSPSKLSQPTPNYNGRFTVESDQSRYVRMILSRGLDL